MTKDQARNVAMLLQREPMYYRNFGVWWWHVKDELKRHGYSQDEVFHLGSFDDPSVRHFYDGMSTVDLDRAAYEQQYAHTFHKYNCNMTHTPDGEPYLIHDQDAE